MADLAAALYSRLSGFAGLAALTGTRIYPGRAPDGATRPYISYFGVSARRERAMGADPGLVRARVQIDVWAESYASAAAMREQIRLALERWSGSAAGTTVQDTYYENSTELYEDDARLHHFAEEYEIVHEE